MALGALIFNQRVKRAENPALWYVWFEVILALYAVPMPFLFSRLPGFLPVLLNSIIGQNQSIAGLLISFIVAGILFLPATVCLGATLPAITEARKRAMPEDMYERGMGRLYGSNTFGATLGIFVTVYLILPRVGMGWGSVILALCSIAAALCVTAWQKNSQVFTNQNERTSSNNKKKVLKSSTLLIFLFITGFAGIGFEVVGVQILSQVFRNTIYTFANILGVFLVGTAVGAWLYSVTIKRVVYSFETVLALLLAGLSFFTLLAAFPLANSLTLLHSIAPLANSSFVRHLVGEIVVLLFIFFIPTLFMGALFAHLISQFTDSGIGRAVAINTTGAALSPVLFALVFIEFFGYSGSFYLAAVSYLTLFLFTVFTWKVKPIFKMACFSAIIFAGLISPKDCVILKVAKDQRIIKRFESIMGQVMVVEEKSASQKGEKNRYLQVDRFYTMGGGDPKIEMRQAFIPLLLTSGKGRILFLGVGTGVFVNSARAFNFDTIDAVEIVPEIIEALDYFAYINDTLSRAEKVNLYCSDARRYVSATKNSYDVIFGDLFHPSRPGASFLLTSEHFKKIKSRLNQNGVFIQYIPLYQYDVASLKTVLRTFLGVFPSCHAFLGRINYRNILIVIGFNNEKRSTFDFSTLQDNINSIQIVRSIVYDVASLFAYYLMDSKGISDFAGKGPLNTDFYPQIMFDAPKLAYESIPSERLASLSILLDKKASVPGEIVFDKSDEKLNTFHEQTDTYGKATVSYLKAEILSCTAQTPDKRPKEAIDLYVRTYELCPPFALNQDIPFKLYPNFRIYHKIIFPRLIAATPDKKWLYVDYLNILKNVVKDDDQFKAIYNQALPVFDGVDSLNKYLSSSNLFK